MPCGSAAVSYTHLDVYKRQVSQANLQTLSKGGGKYLLAMPMRRGDEVTQEVLSRPGRYRSVAQNLQVKEVVVGEMCIRDSHPKDITEFTVKVGHIALRMIDGPHRHIGQLLQALGQHAQHNTLAAATVAMPHGESAFPKLRMLNAPQKNLNLW